MLVYRLWYRRMILILMAAVDNANEEAMAALESVNGAEFAGAIAEAMGVQPLTRYALTMVAPPHAQPLRFEDESRGGQSHV